MEVVFKGRLLDSHLQLMLTVFITSIIFLNFCFV